jgi:hypothetical protein
MATPPIPVYPAPDPLMVAFMGGATAVGCLVAGLFFLRFWTRTRDRLFLAFAVAFWLMAANQALPVLMSRSDEAVGGIYLLRLTAFLLIIGAILAKNLRKRPRI